MMVTHKGVNSHRADRAELNSNLNASALQDIQKSMFAMAHVVQQMGETWTSLATKRSHDDSDIDDDGPTEVKRQQADLDNVGDLFDASEAEAGNIDVFTCP